MFQRIQIKYLNSYRFVCEPKKQKGVQQMPLTYVYSMQTQVEITTIVKCYD